MKIKQLKEIIRTHKHELSNQKIKVYIQWITDDGKISVKAHEIYEQDIVDYIPDIFSFRDYNPNVINVYLRLDDESDKFFGNGNKKEGDLAANVLLFRDAIYVFYAQHMLRPRLLKSPKSPTPLHDKLRKDSSDILFLIDFQLQLTGKILQRNNTVSKHLWGDSLDNTTLVNKKTKKEVTEQEIVAVALKYHGIDINALKKEKLIKRE